MLKIKYAYTADFINLYTIRIKAILRRSFIDKESILLKRTQYKILICILLFIIFASLLIALNTFKDQLTEPGPHKVDFELTDLANKTHRLNDYRGQLLIINFWASWCAPCREEIPSMNSAWAQLKAHKVVMLAVNFGEPSQVVNDFVKQVPIHFPVLLDPDNQASSDWQVTAMPTTLVISRQGKILDRILGPREWDSPEMVKKLLSLAQ